MKEYGETFLDSADGVYIFHHPFWVVCPGAPAHFCEALAACLLPTAQHLLCSQCFSGEAATWIPSVCQPIFPSWQKTVRKQIK